MWKTSFKKFLIFPWSKVYIWGVNRHLFTPSIIIPIDGGICSQMHQYLIGEIFRRKGYRVEYGLRFFETWGKDINGLQVRNFDLLRAFPYLPFRTASRWKIIFYSQCFPYMGHYPESKSKAWIHLLPPCCLLGYYADPERFYPDFYPDVFRIDPTVLDTENRVLYDSISTDSVAVHVRRGDLSSYNIAYGYPVPVTYFVDSVKYMIKHLSSPVFYFFSDDKNYVENELIPLMDPGINYRIIDNGVEKGYMDLILISKCQHQITSKGTLGKYGALFNMSSDKIIIVSKDDAQTFMFEDASCQIVVL